MAITAQLIQNENRFPGAKERTHNLVDTITNKALMDLVAHADPLTPVDTGDLKNRKVISLSRGGQGGQVHWTMFYALYQEKGTARGIVAKLFATTGLARVQPGWLSAYRQIGGVI